MAFRQVADVATSSAIAGGSAQQRGMPAGLADQSQQDFDQRGLARSIRPKKPEDGAGFDRKGNTAQGVDVTTAKHSAAEGLLQRIDFNGLSHRVRIDVFPKKGWCRRSATIEFQVANGA